MARKRGFFAEMAHQAAVAEKNRQRAQAAAVKDQMRRQREAERLRDQLARLDARQAVEAEREQKQLRIQAGEAEVERLNGELALQIADIDGVLSATLEVDDYVDLEKLRTTVDIPPFQSRYAQPIPVPAPPPSPAEPVYVEPEAPRGVGAVFGGRKKHAEVVSQAAADFARAHEQWERAVSALPELHRSRLAEHQQAEQARRGKLAFDELRYESQLAAAERTAVEANADLDEFIRNLDRGVASAVVEYMGVVFANSVYPAEWPWPPTAEYDADTKELSVRLPLPVPAQLPTTRQYKYVRSTGEVTSTQQPQKEQKDRYAGLVAGMTLRTLHEVWEADRRGQVDTISLVGEVTHVDPATGRDTATPLVAAAVDRRTFLDIDLGRVDPAETLRHLGAVTSKNPHGLVPIPLTPGVTSR